MTAIFSGRVIIHDSQEEESQTINDCVVDLTAKFKEIIDATVLAESSYVKQARIRIHSSKRWFRALLVEKQAGEDEIPIVANLADWLQQDLTYDVMSTFAPSYFDVIHTLPENGEPRALPQNGFFEEIEMKNMNLRLEGDKHLLLVLLFVGNESENDITIRVTGAFGSESGKGAKPTVARINNPLIAMSVLCPAVKDAKKKKSVVKQQAKKKMAKKGGSKKKKGSSKHGGGMDELSAILRSL